MAELFTWVPFFEEMADRLRAWRDRQGELIHLLDELRKSGYLVPELTDIDSSNNRFGLREIDPFTTFALFNRGITDANRLALCAALGRELGVKTAPPNDMAGVPVVHNQRTWFFCYARERQQGDIPTLWSVFEAALHANALDNAGFRAAFDAALRVKGVRFNLTMGLFWIRPQVFASLDGTLQAHAELKISAQQLNSDIYLRAI